MTGVLWSTLVVNGRSGVRTGDVLPGGAKGTRTPDPLLAKHSRRYHQLRLSTSGHTSMLRRGTRESVRVPRDCHAVGSSPYVGRRSHRGGSRGPQESRRRLCRSPRTQHASSAARLGISSSGNRSRGKARCHDVWDGADMDQEPGWRASPLGCDHLVTMPWRRCRDGAPGRNSRPPGRARLPTRLPPRVAARTTDTQARPR